MIWPPLEIQTSLLGATLGNIYTSDPPKDTTSGSVERDLARVYVYLLFVLNIDKSIYIV